MTARITYINAKSGSKYKKQVLSQAQQRYENRVLPARRGDIYDRNGNLLATSNKVYNVILDCKAVNEQEEYTEPTVRALVDVLGLDEKEIRSRLSAEDTKNSQYQILKKQISMDEKKAFEEATEIPEDVEESGLTKAEIKERNNVKGVWFEEDYLRIYPFNESACDTIGFTLSRDVADIGLESYYNSTLMGADGRQYGYFNNNADVEQTIIEPVNGRSIETSLDIIGLESYYNSTLMGADGRQYGYFNNNADVEQTIIEPVNGRSIETSLDIGAQQIVEKYVNAFNEKMGAKHVGVIVEDPSTGEIIAMDGGDRYDLNNPRDLSGVYSKEEI